MSRRARRAAERTQALSLIASSFGLGTVIGPALAPLLVFPGLGLTGPFAAFVVLGVVTLIALRLRLPNDEPQFAARGSAYDAPYGSSGSRDRDTDHGDDAHDSASDDARDNGGEVGLTNLPSNSTGWNRACAAGWSPACWVAMPMRWCWAFQAFWCSTGWICGPIPAAGAGPVGIVLMCGAIATLLAQWGVIPRMHLGPRAAILWGVALGALGTVMLGACRRSACHRTGVLASHRWASACSAPVSMQAHRWR